MKIDGLADAVMKELKAFEKATTEDMKASGKIVAKAGAKKLKETSPVGRGSRKGHYKDGWGVTEEITTKRTKAIIHNKKKPGLVHLLEKGHAISGGGRARAIPHVKKVEDWCNMEFEKEVIRRIKT